MMGLKGMKRKKEPQGTGHTRVYSLAWMISAGNAVVKGLGKR
jgi:hypothetical protein